MADNNDCSAPQQACYWLSQGVEVLFEEVAKGKAEPGEPNFDVLIVGSGYGGSIAAAEFSAASQNGRPVSVCVLERGLEYLPGMFPTSASSLGGFVRFSTPADPRPRGKREGLFDVRVDEDICAVLASGLGGGSLINAGVLMAPHDSVLREEVWPEAVRRDIESGSFAGLMNEVTDVLCAAAPGSGLGATNTILKRSRNGSPLPPPPKFEAMRRISSSTAATPLGVAMAASTTGAGVALSQCLGCGDCATGCNFSAKISNDLNLLALASQQGARIFTGATVLRVRPHKHRFWSVEVNYTDDQLRRRQGEAVSITARRVVLAAGTYGSTEILLRSQSSNLKFSEQLGQRFSGNGDMLAAIWGADSTIHAVVDEASDPSFRNVGPTITSIIDHRGERDKDYVVEELSVPGALRGFFAELFTTTKAVHDLAKCDTDKHGGERIDPIAVDPQIIEQSTAIALIGRDSADGRMMLTDGADPDAGDGAIRVVWPQARNDPNLQKRLDRFKEELGNDKGGKKKRGGLGGALLPNPFWRLLPADLQFLVGNRAGPLLTVHPLGGCAMGDHVACGVVDHLGRVFAADRGRDSPEVYDGLVVLDGSIVPTSLGINPALTIATLATRAVRQLRTVWFTPAKAPGTPKPLPPRVIYASPRGTLTRAETCVEFVERMSGTIELDIDERGTRPYVVELTLRFRPVPIIPWLTRMKRRLRVDAGFSRVRIFEPEEWTRTEEMKDTDALVVAAVSGFLHVLQREPSRPWRRIARSLGPWLRNRGLRDLFQGWTDGERSRSPLALASRAGERRSFRYRLRIASLIRPQGQPPDAVIKRLFEGARIEGCKRLTYSRRANPWWQLTTMKVRRFPGWSTRLLKPEPELRFDLFYLARIGVPLLRIVKQQNQVDALTDLISLAMYLARLLLHIHIWTFRKPDAPKPRIVDRLPGAIEGLPPPTIEWLALQPPRKRLEVRLRLTRYAAATPARPVRPVLLIHGYSASGTTFAHPSVRPGLAEYLHGKGHDVWIVDLRTSAGLPETAKMGWAFEDAAYADIPLAVDHILRKTGSPKLDIVAHCMGAAMTWMALLGPGPMPPARDCYRKQRKALPLRVRKLVASQVGPVNIFSPDNTLRAYVMRYIKLFTPLTDYRFRVGDDPGLIDQLLDRLLASLPYPPSEFDRENPFPWFCKHTPWVGTRHRIDALYARAFELNNVSDAVLDAIDDFFGPLSVETVSQAIHFATYRVLTDRYGVNRFVRPQTIRARLNFPILTIHGEQNGLVDVGTARLVQDVLRSRHPGIDLRSVVVSGAGHQDCLIGSRRYEVFERIGNFLS